MDDLIEKTKYFLTSKKSKCAQRGLPFDISYDWVYEKLEFGYCEATGLPFSWARAKDLDTWRNPHGPSIDQIEPSGGYIEDNCQMVVFHYNLAKSAFSVEQLTTLARAILEPWEVPREVPIMRELFPEESYELPDVLTHKRLATALRQLPDRERSYIEKTFYEEVGHSALAEKERVSRPMVTTVIQRGLRRMKTLMARQDR